MSDNTRSPTLPYADLQLDHTDVEILPITQYVDPASMARRCRAEKRRLAQIENVRKMRTRVIGNKWQNQIAKPSEGKGMDFGLTAFVDNLHTPKTLVQAVPQSRVATKITAANPSVGSFPTLTVGILLVDVTLFTAVITYILLAL